MTSNTGIFTEHKLFLILFYRDLQRKRHNILLCILGNALVYCRVFLSFFL